MEEGQQFVGFGRFYKLLIIIKKLSWGSTEPKQRILASKGNILANFNIQYRKFTLNMFGDSNPIGLLLSVKTWLFSWSLGQGHTWALSMVHVHIFTNSLNYMFWVWYFFALYLFFFVCWFFYTALSHKLWEGHL